MTSKSIRYLVLAIKGGLFILPILSLLVSNVLFFPFITTKNFFFRTIVEILFFLWVFLIVFDKRYRPSPSPLLFALIATLFFLSLATIFGLNPYHSFWSNFERMEGLVGHLHIFAYFLILSSVLKSKKDWKILFLIMIGVSILVSLYGFLQLLGKLSIHQSGVRLDATLGNATYLAIFLIFHLFLISLFIFWWKNRWLRLGLVFLFLGELLIIFFTATRGAILGFLGGLFLFGSLAAFLGNSARLRYLFVFLLIFIVSLVGVFWLCRDKAFVRNHYVLARFASLSLSDKTVESRLTIWRMSLKGFQERPILGWGPENYILVFAKYYEPQLWNQEPWFDRAHNIVFDWLISSGLLGFLAYLTIFASALYMVWKGFKEKIFSLFESSALTSLFGAYFFHNLFVFDNLTSYFMFFSILGFVQFLWLSKHRWIEEKMSDRVSDREKVSYKNLKKDLSFKDYFIVTSAFLLVIFALYFVNLKPYLACRKLIDTLVAIKERASPQIVLKDFKEVFSYKTFANAEASEQLAGYVNNIWSSPAFSKRDKIKAVKLAIKEMEEQVEIYKNDVRYLIFLGSLYTRAGQYQEALKVLDKALSIAPKKQAVYFVKADVYLALGRYKEALRVIKKAYDLDPSYPEAAKNLAVLYIINNQKEKARQILIKHFSKEIIPDRQLLNAYAKVGDYEKVKEIWLEFLKRDPNNAQFHVSLAATYMQLGDSQNAIKELQKAAELNPRFKNQAEYYIEKIRNGQNP